MKRLLLILGILISFSFGVNKLHDSNTEKPISENTIEKHSVNKELISIESGVYVCGGKYAKKFHSRSNCRGLNNCKSKIYHYESQQAALNSGFDYCKICWK